MYNNSRNPQLITSYFGEWWMASQIENKITGNLSVYSKGNYILETNSFFEIYENYIDTTKYKHFELEGVGREHGTNETFLFRLLYCFVSKKSFATSGFQHIQTTVSYFIKSKAHKTAELYRFNQLLISCLNLGVWINEKSLNYKGSNQGFELKYEKQKFTVIHDSDLFSVKIGNGFKLNYPNHEGFNFQLLPSFVIDYKNFVSVDESGDLANKLNWFISFSCFSPTYVTSYELNNLSTNSEGYNSELIYHDKFVDNTYKNVLRQNFIITAKDLYEEPELLGRWLKVVDDNPLLVKNFIGVLRNSSDFVENQFLSLINGVLTFAEQKLFTSKNSNEKNLFKTFQAYENCWKEFYNPKRSTTNEMIGRRHVLVHNSDRVNRDSFKTDDFRLNWFRTQLQFVVMSIIMRELGFSDSQISKRLTKIAMNKVAFDKENI